MVPWSPHRQASMPRMALPWLECYSLESPIYCVCPCLCMYVAVCSRYELWCVPMKTRNSLRSHPSGIIHLLLFNLKQSLSQAWNSPRRLSWWASFPQASACFLLPTGGRTSMDHHDWGMTSMDRHDRLSGWVLGIKPSSSCLQGK